MGDSEDAVSSTPSNVIFLFPQNPPVEVAGPDEPATGPDVGSGSREVSAAELALYSATQVARLLGIPAGRLRYWARAGLVVPSGQRGRRRFYAFQDLVALRAAAGLLRGGLSAHQVSRAVASLQRRIPCRASPLAELRLTPEGSAVVVREAGARFEAETGQLLFDFDLNELHRQVVELIQPLQAPDLEQRQRAFDEYLEGCRLETQPEELERSEHAYRRAIELDPKLACAYTNLGNLRYRIGAVDDARALYRKAIELEPEQPEAHYNLAFLTYEEGDLEAAVDRFGRALELDPDFADAHFNLAMALLELGRRDEARAHLATYLELEPDGPWAELACDELGK
jgi:tetratricopeptide (TPR) repeat protein